ncbi:hypothetical protein ES332_D10G199300v1 [Gossypium tomentosum]|uniref:Uncharacterized protein n=2 Tax=Gossypium TaxID=3633 RepID=A0A5D2J747_GOSTO|nr:hypothetical protein ES332_D10G199300v1 [Gossypium tomentosum]
MHTNVQKWVTPLSGYLKFYIYGYMDGALSTASIEEAYHNERREALVVFAPDLMAIVVIGSCPGLLLCVGVWVCAMAVMTTFFLGFKVA